MAKKKPEKRQPSKPTKKGTAASPRDATGREVAVPVPEKVPGRNGGTLVRHPEGSNGGTRRGPDLTPRKVAQAMILKALSDEGVVVVNRGRPTRTKGSVVDREGKLYVDGDL